MFSQKYFPISVIFAASILRSGFSDERVLGDLTENVQTRRSTDDRTKLDIWLYRGASPQLYRNFETVQVVINAFDEKSAENLKMYQRPEIAAVIEEFDKENRFVNSLLRRFTPIWNPSTYLKPFKSTFVGVETESSYEIYLKRKHIDYRLVASFLSGIAIFLTANRLSRSAGAFYVGGTALGIVGSLLIFVMIIYRLTPKRSMAISVLIGGYSMVAYLAYAIWTNLYEILTQHFRLVAIYFVSIASISFMISYYYGPPKNVRALNVLQWTLQFFGCLLIYLGCQIPEAAAAVVVSMIIINNLPDFVWQKVAWLRYRLFPPTRRLLSEEEFIAEGARETRRALDSLREFCRSPDCDSWKTVSRLSSPQVFAEFVSGKRSHIADDEVLRYNLEDDEDDDRGTFDNEEDDVGEEEIIDMTTRRNGGNDSGGNMWRSFGRSTSTSKSNHNSGRLNATFGGEHRSDQNGSRFFRSFNTGSPQQTNGDSASSGGGAWVRNRNR